MPGINDPMNRGGGMMPGGGQQGGGSQQFGAQPGGYGQANQSMMGQGWQWDMQGQAESMRAEALLRQQCLAGDGRACNQLKMQMQMGGGGPSNMNNLGGGGQMGQMIGSMYGQQGRGAPGLGAPGRGAGMGMRQR